MRTSDGACYYFEECKQEADNVLCFRPFAAVSKGKDARPDDPPYVVISDAAYLTFASKVSFPPTQKASPGAIVGARLEGDVLIQGPNSLEIKGRNFYFQKDPNVVYSDDRVQFKRDNNRGRAKGIQLQLLKNESAKADDAVSIGGISSIKLLQDVEMTLVQNPSEPASSRDIGQKRKPAQAVLCQSVGSFNFVLASREATFERNVRIRRESSPGKFDLIAADDSIRIVFEDSSPKALRDKAPPASKAVRTTKAIGPDGQPMTTLEGLQFKELHAHGKVVNLVSESNQFRAVMHDLDYNAVSREARLSAAPNRVQVFHNQDWLRAPSIQLKHDPAGRQITEIYCLGPGDMRHVDEKTKEVDLVAEWKKEMRKHPDPQSSFDLVDFEDAIIERPNEGSGIAADHIRLWIAPSNADQTSVRSNQPALAQRSSTPRLDHMLAEQRVEKVAMVSRQFEAEARRLEIWFEDGLGPAPRSDQSRSRARTTLVPTSLWLAAAQPRHAIEAPLPNQKMQSVPSDARQPTNERKRSSAGPVDGRADQKADSPEPFVMKADSIVVRLKTPAAGRQPEVDHVISKGDVRLTQAQRGQAEPFAVEGNVLGVHNHGGELSMIVLGQPAHVHNRGANIEGSRIVMDRAKNTADVTGAGRLQLPSHSATGNDGPDRSMPLDVAWQEAMHFDGQLAAFEGSVRCRMEDRQDKSEVRCRKMRVRFTERVSFANEHQQQEPRIQTIDCDGGVVFESDSMVDDRLTEVRRGRFNQFHLDQTTGKCEAHGPHLLLRVWRRNENGQSGLSQFATVQSNSPPKSRKNMAWEFMQVTADGPMHGDFTDMIGRQRRRPEPSPSNVHRASSANSMLGANGAWKAGFSDNVQVLYGPVDEPLELVSRDDLQDRSGYMRCNNLFIEQHPQSNAADQKLTLLARGNGKIEGKDFGGEAETISYDSSTGFYVLHAGARGLAKIWRQKRVGDQPTTIPAVTLKFNPTQNILKIEQATGVNATQ